MYGDYDWLESPGPPKAPARRAHGANGHVPSLRRGDDDDPAAEEDEEDEEDGEDEEEEDRWPRRMPARSDHPRPAGASGRGVRSIYGLEGTDAVTEDGDDDEDVGGALLRACAEGAESLAIAEVNVKLSAIETKVHRLRERVHAAALSARRAERLAAVLVVLVAVALSVLCSVPLGEGSFLPPTSADCARAGPAWTRTGGPAAVGWLGWLRRLLVGEERAPYLLSRTASGALLWGAECLRVTAADCAAAAARLARAGRSPLLEALGRSLLLERARSLLEAASEARAAWERRR